MGGGSGRGEGVKGWGRGITQHGGGEGDGWDGIAQ